MKDTGQHGCLTQQLLPKGNALLACHAMPCFRLQRGSQCKMSLHSWYVSLPSSGLITLFISRAGRVEWISMTGTGNHIAPSRATSLSYSWLAREKKKGMMPPLSKAGCKKLPNQARAHVAAGQTQANKPAVHKKALPCCDGYLPHARPYGLKTTAACPGESSTQQVIRRGRTSTKIAYHQ